MLAWVGIARYTGVRCRSLSVARRTECTECAWSHGPSTPQLRHPRKYPSDRSNLAVADLFGLHVCNFGFDVLTGQCLHVELGDSMFQRLSPIVTDCAVDKFQMFGPRLSA